MEPSRGSAPPGVSARFWALLTPEQLGDADVLDVGTGAGRLALALAPHSRRVVGIDREPGLIAEARVQAAAARLTNAEFAVADADAVDYVAPAPDMRLQPDLVVAHLFLSDALIESASRALAPGRALAFVGFHVDQWRETGRPSRFAWDESRVSRRLAECGFDVEHLELERDVQRFDSVEQGLAAAIGLAERWKADGRWFRYIKFLEEGGRTLTRSHLLVRARRRAIPR
jgi:SAM-dependent methyltransferase